MYLSHNLTLKGFFHSLKYFENVSAELRKAYNKAAIPHTGNGIPGSKCS